MADKSSIEWTDATWNPITGCTKISPGCDNCYAERFAERFRGVPGHPYKNGFDLELRPERLSQPRHWRQSRMIFVNSMSDLFHKDISESYILSVIKSMEEANWHQYQVLTKRSSRMKKVINKNYTMKHFPEYIWMGVSVEDGKRKSRITHLRDTNCQVKFLSIEPLIGPIGNLDLTEISWVIVGGESGPRSRPMSINWAREVRDQCIEQNVPFFFKQWGGTTSNRAQLAIQGAITSGEIRDFGSVLAVGLEFRFVKKSVLNRIIFEMKRLGLVELPTLTARQRMLKESDKIIPKEK